LLKQFDFSTGNEKINEKKKMNSDGIGEQFVVSGLEKEKKSL